MEPAQVEKESWLTLLGVTCLVQPRFLGSWMLVFTETQVALPLSWALDRDVGIGSWWENDLYPPNCLSRDERDEKPTLADPHCLLGRPCNEGGQGS